MIIPNYLHLLNCSLINDRCSGSRANATHHWWSSIQPPVLWKKENTFQAKLKISIFLTVITNWILSFQFYGSQSLKNLQLKNYHHHNNNRLHNHQNPPPQNLLRPRNHQNQPAPTTLSWQTSHWRAVSNPVNLYPTDMSRTWMIVYSIAVIVVMNVIWRSLLRIHVSRCIVRMTRCVVVSQLNHHPIILWWLIWRDTSLNYLVSDNQLLSNYLQPKT